MTGYQLKKIIEKSTGHFFKMSFGSIYPSLHRLNTQGFLEMQETTENGKTKKVYSITPAGKEKFIEWLRIPPEVSLIEEEFLAKLNFFENLTPKEIRHSIHSYLEKLSELKWKLAEIEEFILNYERQYPSSDLCFKKATVKFGLQYYDLVRDWFYDILKELDKKRI